MEAYLSDTFLDRVRRAYRRGLDAGAKKPSRLWAAIDARRRDIHEALLASGNASLRAIFADPIATDLYYGTDNLCRSIMGSSNGRPFLELALETARAAFARYSLSQLHAALTSINGTSVVEIGPGVGHCAFYAYRAGLTDYTTIDLPLGLVAQARFLAEALGPDKLWMDGDPGEGTRDQIKLFSSAHLPDRRFDAALNVNSMPEMSLTAALDYLAWIDRHARLLLSINHENNPFTVTDIAKYALTAKRLDRMQIPNHPYYFQETFLVGQRPQAKSGLFWLRSKTLFWGVVVRIRWRIPLIRPEALSG